MTTHSSDTTVCVFNSEEDLIHVYTYRMGECKEDRDRHFSKNLLNNKKNLLPVRAIEGRRRLSIEAVESPISGDIQNLPSHSSGQPALADSTLSSGLD